MPKIPDCLARAPGPLRAAAAAALFLSAAACAWAAPAPPVYVHMNGANEFLENVVAVRPGQPVVFVDQDTGVHTIVGYAPATGAGSKRFDGAVAGTPGPGHPVHTYTVRFRHPGLKYYYCSVHAELAKEPGGVTLPKKRPTVGGYGTPMAGLIIVTTDPHLLADNPASSSHRILPGFFGG